MARLRPEIAGTAEETIRKSRFIGIMQRVRDETEFKRLLLEHWRQHPHASHIAWACRLLTTDGGRDRFSDDHEPSGTAGRPMLAHLSGQDIVQVAVFAVRYFGGIELGTGGLARAYGGIARAAIQAGRLVPHIEESVVEIIIDYARLDWLERQLPAFGARIRDKSFTDQVHLVLEVPTEHLATVAALGRPAR